MNAGTPKKTAINEELQVKAAKTQSRTPKQTAIGDLMNAGTPKKTAIDEDMNAGTPKKTAIDEGVEVKAAKTQAHTPKKTAIDEERRRSPSRLSGKPQPFPFECQ